MNQKLTSIVVGLLIVVLLAGCSGAASSPTLDPKIIYTQVAQTVAAQITNAAKLTPQATFTLAPSATPAPSQTPKATNATIAALTGTPVSLTSLPLTTSTPTVVASLAAIKDKMEFIGQSPSDNVVFKPDQAFTMIWTIKNIGATTWNYKYLIRYYAGIRCGADDDAVGGTIDPDETYNVKLAMVAPPTPGKYTTMWVITNPDGINFGSFYLAFEVK